MQRLLRIHMAKREIDSFLRHWLNGDESVFKDVVNYYYHQMYAFAIQMVRNREDAEELVMNAFLKLWQHKRRIVYVSRPEEYLFGILRREVIGYARKRVVANESLENISLLELGVEDHPEFTLHELNLRYQNALAKLTPRQRAIFLMSREQDMSQQEIADSTGISVNTVSNHMNAALKVFHEEWKKYPDALLLLLFISPTLTLLMS